MELGMLERQAKVKKGGFLEIVCTQKKKEMHLVQCR
jgi:hypothetical protein